MIQTYVKQGNAPVHTARVIEERLATQGVEVMNWPPYSPDLNPIEHAWKHLKDSFQKAYLHFCNETGKSDEQKKMLGELPYKCWVRITPEDFEAPTKSMEDRAQAVLGADGWYTHH